MLLKNEIRGDYIFMLGKYWIQLLIATIIISLISIKAFPLAIGALYLPVIQSNKITTQFIKRINR